MFEVFVLFMGTLPLLIGLYAIRIFRSNDEEGGNDPPPPPPQVPPPPHHPSSPRQRRRDRPVAAPRPAFSRHRLAVRPFHPSKPHQFHA